MWRFWTSYCTRYGSESNSCRFNDLQSLYVANNVCSAVEYFRKLGGNVGVAGLVINKDDGTGEAAAFAKAADIPVLASIPQDDDLRKNLQIIKLLERPMGMGRFIYAACRSCRRCTAS